MIRDDKKKEVIKIFRSPYNFAKHADLDSPDIYEKFHDNLPNWTIFIAIGAYSSIYKTRTLEMILFFAWMVANNEEIVSDSERDKIVPFCSELRGDHKMIVARELCKTLRADRKALLDRFPPEDYPYVERI